MPRISPGFRGSVKRLVPQAGPARIRALLAQAGFSRVSQVAQTPFNYVLEARP